MATRLASRVEQGRGATIGVQVWNAELERFMDHSRCTPDEADELRVVRDQEGERRTWRAREMYGRGKIVASGE